MLSPQPAAARALGSNATRVAFCISPLSPQPAAARRVRRMVARGADEKHVENHDVCAAVGKCRSQTIVFARDHVALVVVPGDSGWRISRIASGCEENMHL